MHQNTLEKLLPKRKKVETISILRKLSTVSNALGELKGVAKTIPNQSMLINAVVLQEAKDSSEIENIITTQDDLYKAISTKSKYSTQIKEVINYREAIFLGYNIIKKYGFLRLRDIENIQQTIIENNAGIRKIPGTVLKNDRTGETIYTPPQKQEEILDLLSNFLDHFNTLQSDLSPLINLAILHYQFESIHPFYDGNGRTGRILNILYLILNNLLDIPILYLSSYINSNKQEYYKLLNHVYTTDSWESWILFNLQAIETTSKITVKKINFIKMLLIETELKVQQDAPKIYRKELIELLFEQPYSKIEYVTKKLHVERKTASRYLKQLEQIGILKSQKIGRELIYINTKLMVILSKM